MNDYHDDVAKVLILDDREDYRRALQAALRREFDVICAGTAEEANRLMDATVQVALVDVRLSEEDPTNRDGLAFLGKVRQQYPHTPVIMMSAYRDVDADTTFEAGADCFLREPIDLRKLRALLHEFAEHGRSPERTAQLKAELYEGKA